MRLTVILADSVRLTIGKRIILQAPLERWCGLPNAEQVRPHLPLPFTLPLHQGIILNYSSTALATTFDLLLVGLLPLCTGR